MSREQVYNALKTSGLPVAHCAFPVGKAPKLPWVVFKIDDDTTFYADNSRYQEQYLWRVDLLEKYADEQVEQKVEDAICSLTKTYSKDETWSDSEGCLMTIFTFNY